MERFQTTPAIALITFLSVVLILTGLHGILKSRSGPTIGRLRKTYREKFVTDLQFADDFEKMFLAYVVITLIVTVIAAIKSVALALLVPLIAVAIPPLTYNYLKGARIKKIEEALPSVLQQLASNTQSVGSLSVAMAEVAKTAPAPLDYELGLISKQEEELKSFSQAIDNARLRINSRWFDIVASVLITASEKGGKSSSALENLSQVFVQLTEMQNTISTATSQGRMSLKMLIPLPVIVVIVISFLDPNLVSSTVNSGAGVVVLCLSLFFYMVSLGIAAYLSQAKV